MLTSSVCLRSRVFRRVVVLAMAVIVSSVPGISSIILAESQKAVLEPFVVEYYYKVRWGYVDEFLHLFRKNHFPVLAKQMEDGRILKVTAVKPRYHSSEEGRWDLRVTIVFKDVVASLDTQGEDAVKRQLYPDQQTFLKEEQRRFEILQAHWDVPINEVPLKR
jgi:hypothetical protein